MSTPIPDRATEEAERQAPTLGPAVAAFLAAGDFAPSTRAAYGKTLRALAGHLDTGRPVDQLRADELRDALAELWGSAAPATWNRNAATLGSFATWAADCDWLPDEERARLARLVRRRRVRIDHDRVLSRDTLTALWARRDLPLRERTLWRMLYETAGRAEEVLCLDIEDLDLANRTARTVRKGGDLDLLHYASGTAQILPRLLAGRTRGPVFLAQRPPRPGALLAVGDTDPDTGRGRLSYRRAAETFTEHTGATLHQLRHSALTHLAEDGVPTALLMAKSRHASIRSLARYAQPSQAAVARLTADHDPARRRHR